MTARGTVGLSAAYGRWRRSRLGRITDTIEQSMLLEQIGPVAGLRILDAGCGDGELAAILTDRGALATAVDRDTAMLAAARRRTGHSHAAFALCGADLHDLPFADASFDRVVAVTVLCFVISPHDVMCELVRVLRPGGQLIIGELNRWSVWSAWRQVRGLLGNRAWRKARFHSTTDLRALASRAGLKVDGVTGAVFYPPLGWAAAIAAGLDRCLGARMVAGSAFLVVVATRLNTGQRKEASVDEG